MAAARRLDRYELLEEIGAGGMATVYRALDSELEREVAVKVLHPHMASQPDARTRFQREAKAVAKLRHPNILDIFDYSGTESEESYIVVELIHGPTLKRFVEGAPRSSSGHPVRTTPVKDGVGRVPIEVAAMIVHEICGAVAAAHAQGIIHRDIKPENVMIREDGVLKLTDFGIAQILDANSMTVTGQILGSPAHMAPEQIEAGEIDHRVDVFSVGTVLYWLAAGRLPFEGKNPHHLLKKIMDNDYPDPIRVEPAMGEALAAIIRRCLARAPADRYETADALKADLAAFLLDLDCPEPEIELKKYFRDPQGYATAHREKIVKVLVRRGQEVRKKGELPRALDYFNRVLAIDEHNQEVLRLVGGIERRRRTLQVALGAAVLVVLGAGAGLAYNEINEAPSRRPARVARANTPEVRVVPEKATVNAAPDAGARPAKRPRVATILPRSAAPGGTRVVQFNPGRCKAVNVIVDGTDLGEYGRVLSKEVSVGRHTFEYRPTKNAKCVGGPFEVMVVAGGPDPQRIGGDLRWLPASVIVRVRPRVAASVLIDGRRSPSDAIFEVPMRDADADVDALVRADGYEEEALRIHLTAGVLKEAQVTLRPRSEADSGP